MVEVVPETPVQVEDLPTHLSSRTRRSVEEIQNSQIPAGGCIISKMVGKYGPYRYHVKRVGKKQTWTYLGKGGGGTKHELVSVTDEEAE